jgi:type IV secretion system protein VirB3
MDSFDDPIFRGCTRPAMLLRVPLLPFLLVTGTFMVSGVWSSYLVSGYLALFLILLYIPILIAMRQVTRKDDQRLHQLIMQARLRLPQLLTRRRWGAYSFAPLRYKRRV